MQKKQRPAVECRCTFTTGGVVTIDSPRGGVSLHSHDRRRCESCFAPKGQYPDQQTRMSPGREPGTAIPDAAASDCLFYRPDECPDAHLLVDVINAPYRLQ
ncbi:MAG TPA: hypothetical protein PLA17_10195, partial [Bacteroidales bacterium]|nr:hypothetical protein [Bacteroidales bacterium]